MATLKSDVVWGSGPKIYFDFSYTKKREGSAQYYNITVSCDSLNGTHYFGYPIYLELKLDGTKVATKTLKAASPSQWSSAISYSTGWIKVANKTSGTTALAIRIYSGMGSSRNTTYSYSLPIDPAASKIAATDANVESVSTISITKYSSSFTTTVSYKAAGQSSYTTIWSKQTHTSYGWTIPASLYSIMVKQREIEIELRCQTYSGTTLIGTTYASMTATTASSKCQPVVSISAKDIRAATVGLTGNSRKIVKGVSTLEATVIAEVRNSATFVNTTVTCGSKSQVGTSSNFVATFEKAESETVSSATKDSRDYVTWGEDKLTLINYIAPTVNQTVARENPTSDVVNVSISGMWFNGSFGVKTNSLAAKVRSKPKDQESYTATYTAMVVTADGNNYTASATLSGLVYTDAYDIEIVVTDAVCSGSIEPVITKYDVVRKGIPVFDWGENDFRFNVPVTLLESAAAISGSTDPGTVITKGYVDNHISAHNQHGLVKFRTYEFTGGTAIFDSLKNNWESLPQGTFAALLKSAGGGFGCCFGFKVSNIYGAALYLSYGTGTLEFYRCVNGTWQQHNK